MTRRAALKWLHWLGFAAILYFFLVEPEENRADTGGALSTHAGVGLLLAVVVLVWTALWLRKGLASRPGPKLPPWGKRVHPLLHRALYLGLPAMVLSGGLVGLLAPFAIAAFGVVPINAAGGTQAWHGVAESLHEALFDALTVLIIAHAVFHLWRHYWLRDNALRIMVPKPLHKYL